MPEERESPERGASGDPQQYAEAGLIPALPRVWIGYVLCVVTFIAEAIVIANHPEIASGQLFVPPLPVFLLGFVSFVYWLVCVHKLHVVLEHVPRWKHPVSAARAVWFHFIPIYSLYWLYKWPSEVARFVNWRLNGAGMKPRNAGILVIVSYVLCILFGPGGLILLYFALSHITLWVRRALAAPLRPPPENPNFAS